MNNEFKFSELEGKVISKKGLKVIRVLDSQLTEDKRLFNFLIEGEMVDEEGEILIRKLIDRHTKEFEQI
jgi:hypothetical protein